jgi:ADP-ribose pyrophosphatase YjhB (NUDIX family)
MMPFDDPHPNWNQTSRWPREGERGAYTEKKFANGLIAIWRREELPPDAPITHVTLIPYRGERAVVSWRDGAMRLPEGAVNEGEALEDAVRRVALAQAGILDPAIKQLGHFVLKPANAKDQTPANVTFQALIGVEAGSLADGPADESYQRRIITQRDLNTLIRENYIERRLEYVNALDAWLLERLKAAAGRKA